MGGHVDEVRKELDIFKQSEGAAEAVKIVVSGIFAIQTTVGSGMRDVVVVTCEGVPALFTFTLTPLNQLTHLQTLPLPGNVLAISPIPATSKLLVSIDTIHKAGSTSELRTDSTESLSALQTFEFQDGMLVEGGVAFARVEDGEEGQVAETARLGNLLYGLENLRKREGDGGEE